MLNDLPSPPAVVAIPPELVAVEQLIELQEHLKQLTLLCPSAKSELEQEIERVNSIIALLDEPPVDKTLASARPLLRTKIDRLGLANEILRLREAGSTYEQIAARYEAEGITVAMIARFCQAYSRLKLSDQVRVRRQSIFETHQRLEDVSAILYRLIARLEATQSDEVLVKAVAELRQTAALAQQVTKDMLTYTNYQQFKKDVFEIITEYVAPEQRAEVGRRIAQYAQLNRSLTA